jgi:hypothetical protein
MKRAVAILIPVVLFVAAVSAIALSIDEMSHEENNNRMHAMLLGCQYLGKAKDYLPILYFDCNGSIELHKQIEW